MAEQLRVMISSTARDLPEHRKEAMDACLRQGMFPIMMEHLPASDDEAISASLKMVDSADIYILILAHRYGYVPKENNPKTISITEMEYDRAVERKIRRAVFIVDRTKPLADFTIDDIDIGESAIKLKSFKERIELENIVNYFKSPDDLRAHAVNSLAKHRQPDLTTFHYVSDIPAPPDAFIAHPYTLLQTHRLVGRQPELNLLTDWVAKPGAGIYRARILNVVAVGGLGKSALTWKWFNDIAPQEMKPLAGRMWWSFYESDATFENFVTRALAYVSRRPLDEVQRIPAPDRVTQLLAALDREPFLLVLDGLERILIAYARMDAAHLSDDDYDKQTANFVANAIGLPASAAQSFTGEHSLRKTADPRAGSFLRKLSNVRASRILISTRLYPADLQMGTGEPLGSCAAIFLKGLADDDALELWRAFGATGSRDSLLPLFQRADNHPLLIQALASEVARFRPEPGDFDAWRRAHPDFDPFGLPLVQVKSHVLAFALRGLDDQAQQVLRTVAAFRMPARYDTLADLLIGEGKPCADERNLDEVLTELEDRGLVGWDKRANRYDLHPLVRGVVWSGLDKNARQDIYETLHTHFESILPSDVGRADCLEDLSTSIELYNTLVGLDRYNDACDLFFTRISEALFFKFGAYRQTRELLESLFPEGLDELPRLSDTAAQIRTLDRIGMASKLIGHPEQSAHLHRRSTALSELGYDTSRLHLSLGYLSSALSVSGAMRDCEGSRRRGLVVIRERADYHSESACLEGLGDVLATRGKTKDAMSAFERGMRISLTLADNHRIGSLKSSLATWEFRREKYDVVGLLAERAAELAQNERCNFCMIVAKQLQGLAALGQGDLEIAEKQLNSTLVQARETNLLQEEIPTLVGLAELQRRQDDFKVARELLEDVWELAERGPYPLFHADAFNVLALIERAGNTNAAIEAATKAYQLAWCDGPPFAYHWGLEKAKQHLKQLGAPEPEMPPFDESKFEPMPEVEINPHDEFYVDEESVS